MQLKQANLVLAVSMTIVAVIVAVSAILVVISFSGSSQTAEDRTEKFNKFKRTCDQDPSPTADNIDRLSGNIDVVSNWYDDLLKDLGRDVVFRSVDTASVFGSRREQVINGLRADAPLGLGGAKVIPDGFMFGFEAYREGKMATKEEVPRLLYQLELIDAIIREMYAAKVLSITRVEREVFEQSTGGEDSGEEEQTSSRRGRRGRRDDSEDSGTSGGLTAANKNGDLEDFPLPLNRQKFHFEFLAREESLVDLLNRLASMDRYVAVTSLEFAKTGSDFAPPKEEREARGDGPGPGPGGPGGRPPRPGRGGRFGRRDAMEEAAPAAAAPAAPAAPASRLARSFSGRNLESPIRVQLNVEVYAVRRDESQEAPAEDAAETPEASSDEAPAAADPAEAPAETPAEAPAAEAPAEAPAAEAPAAEAPAAPVESASNLSTPSVLMRGQAALSPHAQAALLEI